MYRVFFTTGQSTLITEDQLQLLVKKILEENIRLYHLLAEDATHYRLINIDHVTHITPEVESRSGVTGRPTPDDLKYQKQKDKEELLKDPNMILKRAVEKDEQH